ncbi:2-phosphosulfolactate phosphatase [Streptomyces goshikiensis]|uniref:2-phosphosulfolactate phosphatase n=1 Tax=Streptomyces goshikiensis TaxID=1942 RepID=UPI0036CCB4AE
MRTRFLGTHELAEVPPVAVVVDVMRAFAVAAWAFAQGAEKIVLAESPDEALALKARHPDWVALKAGAPAPGFDAVNSPALLRSVDLAGRTVARKTTAGTVGALAVKEASLVLCAACELARGVRQGAHPDDVALCLELDRFPFAMVATSEDSLMLLRPSAVPPAWASGP